jgi:NAD(P)-dependent dehydrogenase (short-subunit alcohol dehydrogenase family)
LRQPRPAAALSAGLSSLAEVRRLADLVRHDCDRLNVLINNAGIGSGGSAAKRETSLEGYELRFAVNYLAGFLLTRLLLPLMMVSEPARIVNVSSLVQQPIDFDDVMLTRGYTGGRAYAQSKLAQITLLSTTAIVPRRNCAITCRSPMRIDQSQQRPRGPRH